MSVKDEKVMIFRDHGRPSGLPMLLRNIRIISMLSYRRRTVPGSISPEISLSSPGGWMKRESAAGRKE